MTDQQVWRINLTAPHINANHRLHHMVKARKTKEIRTSVGWCAKSLRIPNLDRQCRVQLVQVVSDRRRRDNDNLEPTFKAAVDGLVDAGVLTDDTPDLVDKARARIVHTDDTNLPKGIWIIVERIEPIRLGRFEVND